MPEQFLFTKEKGSLFNVKVWMKLLVKKSTLCYGNENRNWYVNNRCAVQRKGQLSIDGKLFFSLSWHRLFTYQFVELKMKFSNTEMQWCRHIYTVISRFLKDLTICSIKFATRKGLPECWKRLLRQEDYPTRLLRRHRNGKQLRNFWRNNVL